MSKAFPLVPLGELLIVSEERTDIDPGASYRQVTVRLWGKGVALRGEIAGSEIAASKQFIVKTNQFILSKIDARNGAFGLIPASLDGALVSSDFPVFTLNSSRIIPEFLHWMSKTRNFIDLCKVASEGTTNRVRLKKGRFLATKIPLPSLEEQRRIVARIEELAAKIEEARGLRKEAVEEATSLFSSAMNSIWHNQNGWNAKPIRDLVTIVSGLVDPRDEPYTSMPHINGEAMESGTGKLLSYRIAKDDGLISGKFHFKAGAILYSKIRPYLRKAVQVPVEGICSADVYAFDSIDPVLEPRFFMYSLLAPPFTDYANDLSGRTRMPKLNQDQLFSFHMSYPTIAEQHRIVAYLDGLQSKVDTLKRKQAEASAELDALLPSILDKAFKGEL
jgi:type I restriction enzyme S subunit